MTAHEAHLRLMAALPVRTHTRAEPAATPWTRLGDARRVRDMRPVYQGTDPSVKLGTRKRVITGKGRGGLNRKPVRWHGVTYESIRAAARASGNGARTIYRSLRNGDGRASYVKE